MKLSKSCILAFTLIILASGMMASVQAQFTTGNLAVFQADAVTSNTTFSIVELNPSNPAANPVGTTAIDGTGANALRSSGSATSTGYLSRSNDRTLLTFAAHNSATTAGNANTLNPRGVGILNNAKTFTLATTYTATSGNQARSATTIDNTNFFIADQGGIYTNSATAASPTANVRNIRSFGGTVYVGQASGTPANIQVSTVSAPTGGTITGLPGLTNLANFQDFYLVYSGTNAAFDILYVLSGSATVGTISKYSLVSGTWVANGTYTTSFGGFGIAASGRQIAPPFNGSPALVPITSANIYVTTGAGATAANTVRSIVDNSGYNQTININTPDIVTLYTASATTTVKGIEFAPVSPTAASGVISGRVLTANGIGINKVRLTLQSADSNESRVVVTNPFGYYTFDDLSLGENYIISVQSKKYAFAQPVQAVNLIQSLEEVNFTAEPNFAERESTERK